MVGRGGGGWKFQAVGAVSGLQRLTWSEHGRRHMAFYEQEGKSTLLWRHATTDGVTCVAMSAGGVRIAIGTLGKEVLCFGSTGTLHWRAAVGNQVWHIGMSADGQKIVA